MIRAKIIHVLKDPTDGDKNFQYFVKRYGFQLLHLSNLGVQDVLFVLVKEMQREGLGHSEPMDK